MLWSEDLTKVAFWSASGHVTIAAGQLTEDSNNAQHYLYPTVSLASGKWTLSIYAQIASGTRHLALYPQGTGTAYAIFDLVAGTVSYSAGANYVGSSITVVGGGWYRCAITLTVTAGNLLPVVYLTNSATIPSAVYLGDGTSGILLFGAQLNPGTQPTPYIKTTTAAV